ncbi:MAG: hypothetical protein ACR2L1_04315 [Pyrinomonadaceae bacterium]
MRRIETGTDVFKNQLNRSLDRSSVNGTDTEDSINAYVANFEKATDNLKDRYNARQSAGADVQEVLNRAAYINSFMTQNRLNAVTERQWVLIRNDLNLLANYYNIRWAWTGRMPVNNSSATVTNTTGVYISNDPQLSALLTRIEQRTDTYKREMNRALDRSTLNNTKSEDNVFSYITGFENATDRLRQNYDARKSISADAQEVLYRAQVIDGFMRDNRLAYRAESEWNMLRNDLNSLATYYRVSSDWKSMDSNPYYKNNNAAATSSNAYRVSDGDVQNVLRRIETNTDVYKRDLSSSLDRSVLNGTSSEDQINAYISDFEKATDSLKQRFDARRSVSTDVEEVLNRAYFIDNFMRDYRLPSNVETRWTTIRTDLTTLSNYYNVSWNWVRPNMPVNRLDDQLTGTYRLNTGQSDNVNTVVDRAVTTFYASDRQRDRLRQNLERRLTSPEMIVIEKYNNQVKLASTNSPQITFDADGTAQTEQVGNGRTVKVTANTTYDGVSLNYEGDRVNDFYVNFMPMNNGQLRVIRRIFLENRNDTVTVASVYDKIEQRANFSKIMNSNTAQNNPNNTTISNDFVIQNGTKLTAVLNSALSTKNANEGDRFIMTVQSPSQYDGAIIEGHLSDTQKSGRVSGRAQVTFNFDTIRLRNGQSYRFAGLIDQVRQPNGDTVSINNEGAVRDSNQTTKTVTRAGIGAALGAIIGAIAGGGQGAAIGAAVGAGAGAGTVVLQGRDNLDLETGSQFMITSSAPGNL